MSIEKDTGQSAAAQLGTPGDDPLKSSTAEKSALGDSERGSNQVGNNSAGKGSEDAGSVVAAEVDDRIERDHSGNAGEESDVPEQVNEPRTAAVTFELAEDLTVNSVSAFHEHLAGLLAMEEDVVIDASRVAVVDTAGLQLLLAFSSQIEREHRNLRLENPSPELIEVSQRLDLAGLLKLAI